MGSGHCFGQRHSLNVISMISSFVLNSLEKNRRKPPKKSQKIIKKGLLFARGTGTVHRSSSLAKEDVLSRGVL